MITAEDLTQIADDICGSIFTGADTDAATAAADDAPIRTLSAIVDISGDWNGSVSVSCERTTAVGIASVMFDAPGPELSGSDVIDALGELANMAGGAVKGMLDGEKSLGLPTVGEGIDFVMVVPNTTEVANVDYPVATGGVVHLAVHQVRR
jgi:CheY-specific phosphatase CheX